MTRRTALYRCFDAGGMLLYVGIARSALQRLHQHATAAFWFDAVATVKIEHFATRQQALDAERLAITTESPAYNVALCAARAEWNPLGLPYLMRHARTGRVYFLAADSKPMLMTEPYGSPEFLARHTRLTIAKRLVTAQKSARERAQKTQTVGSVALS